MFKHSQWCPCEQKGPVAQEPFTADRVAITQGMRVFTNNLDRGTVDLTNAAWEWYPSENKHHLWFNVQCDTNYNGEPYTSTVQQSDDRVATTYNGKKA